MTQVSKGQQLCYQVPSGQSKCNNIYYWHKSVYVIVDGLERDSNKPKPKID